MNSKMNGGFLMLMSLVVVGIPGCVCQSEYETCGRAFECGSLWNIGYPFYGGNRPSSCGYPGFGLTCQGAGAPLINISSVTYRVLAITNPARVMRVARNDLWDTLCAPSRLNTTASSPFSFDLAAGDQVVNIYYNCTGGQLSAASLPNRLDCNPDGLFFVTGEPDPSFACNTGISVRVNQIAAQDLDNAIRNSTTSNPALLQNSLRSGFSFRWSADDQSCTTCTRSGGVCGYNQASSSFACFCANGSTCSNASNQDRGASNQANWPKTVMIGFFLCVSGLVILFIITYYYKRCHRFHQEAGNQNVEKFLLAHGSLAPKRYGYTDVKKMTRSFKHKLGRGGFGTVYKGRLPDGQFVAVKVLTETHETAEEFINEVASISRTSHVNIVNLLGFCYHGNKRALIYEFMPNKSLDKFITKNGSTNSEFWLGLDKLYEIALGVARGLDYLHRGCNTRIVHFDIKPQNILLDQDFVPKISDFGLAKLFKKKQSVVSMLGTRGTIGYIAPEVFSRTFGVVSHKSDVYSYGMLLIEMAGARQMDETDTSENYFTDKIYEYILAKNGEVDNTGSTEETSKKMVMIGVWCIQTAPSDRPSMSKVIEMLEGSLESIQIPPKPVFPSHHMLSGSPEFSTSLHMETEYSTCSGNMNQLQGMNL